jgi:hypothetical protein
MEHTLFGVIETKRESADRARKLVELYSAIKEAPGALECRKAQVAQVQHFIDRSAKRSFDANRWDGLQRCIGDDPEDLLDASDLHSMRRDKSYWKKNNINYLNCPPGTIYRCKLHPKEIEYLQNQIAWLQEEIDSIETNVPLLHGEIATLRLVGKLPKDVAERYKLTEDGRENGNGKTTNRDTSA